MTVKYDGIFFENASEVSNYKKLMGLVCSDVQGGDVDTELENEISEINRLENEGFNDEFDTSLELMNELGHTDGYAFQSDDNFGELNF